MRCDLHVHTRHSGMCTVPLLNRLCRESYSEPLAVYEILKQRRMDLVTVTDHDSIDAAESLRRHPDFFLSEEVSATSPSGTRLHIGVYDIRERHHIEVQRRREDLMSLVAYLREERIFFTINHVYSSLTGRRTGDDFALFAHYFPGIEVLNGQIPAFCNRGASELARLLGKSAAGGSDAHTLASLGRTYTAVREARTKEDFLNGVRRGQASLHGESGRYGKLTAAVWKLGFEMMREKPSTLLLSPLALAIPLVTLAHWLLDFAFANRWAPRTSVAGRAAAVGAGAWTAARQFPEAGL